MFVWLFHRVSGVLLIVLLAVQLSTGFFQASSSNAESVKAIADLHNHPALNCLLVVLAVFHGLYGVRTILLDCGLKRERLLFWAFTVLGLVLCGVFMGLFFRFVVR